MALHRATACLAGIAVLALGATAHAAEPGCTDARSRQFDFWVGDWNVYNREGGAVVGHSVVEPILDDCVIEERWEGVSGSAGIGLNFFDPERQAWRQVWLWREGTTLELSGGLVEGRMVLEGPGKGEDGQPRQNRITWFDNPDDTLRQLWEVSSDGGKTWYVFFDGFYQPAGAARTAP